MVMNLIVQRQDDEKVLHVPAGVGGGVAARNPGIQLHQPTAAPPPPKPAPPQRTAPAPMPQPPGRAVNEEELLHTMNEFANPIKKAKKAMGGPQRPMAFHEEDDEEEDDEDEEEGEEGDDMEDMEEEEDEEEEYEHPAAAAGGGGGGYFEEPMAPAEPIDRPSDGFRSIEEEKSDIMFKLQRLHRQGVRGMRQFTPYSDIRDMRAELSRIRTELELERSVKFQRKILMGIVSVLEWGNNKFDPFDLELDGWSEQMHQSVETTAEYDGVFEELYFKYRNKVSAPPEVRLLLMVGGSAMMFHMTKYMMKSYLPAVNPQMVETMMRNVGGGGGQQAQQAPPQQPADGSRREMRGPGIDIGSLMGGGGGGGGGSGGSGGLAGLGGLGSLFGGSGGGGGPNLSSLLGGIVPPTINNIPPPPVPNASLNPAPTRPDRAQQRILQAPLQPQDIKNITDRQAQEDDDVQSVSDRLSDVISEDLESIPDNFSVRSDGSAKNVHVTVPPPRGRAKRAKKESSKKVITL